MKFLQWFVPQALLDRRAEHRIDAHFDQKIREARAVNALSVSKVNQEEDTMPVIAILGAGPGMGLAIAKTFGARGYRVALLSRNPPSRSGS